MAKEPSKVTDKEMKTLACDCKHLYQDEKYGKGMRTHNPNNKGYCCTVCAKQKT